MDRKEHLKRFRGAALVMLVLQSFSLAIAGILLGAGNAAEVSEGWTTLLGAGVIIIPALMAWNGSLIGSVFLIALMVLNLIVGFDLENPVSVASIRSVLFVGLSVWIFVELFRYRRKSRTESLPIGGSSFVRWGGKGAVAVLAGVMALGLSNTYAPRDAVSGLLTARQIPIEQYRWMYENDILGDAERVFLYSGELDQSYSDSGNVLTNKFVGGWWREDGELETGWIKLGEICHVEKVQTTEDGREVFYTLHTYGDDSWLRILLPNRGGDDQAFLARMKYLNNQKMHREVRSACDENREPDWGRIAASNGISPNILSPGDIDPHHLTWLRHNDFLTHKERVMKFYSNGSYSIATGGVLLTDKYFGGWAEDSDGLESWWFEHGELCLIEKKEEATKVAGPRYRVESIDNWFQFNLPSQDGQDKELVKLINELNDAALTDEASAACRKMLDEKESDET